LRSPIWLYSFSKVELGLHSPSMSAPNKVVYVWHPNLFITGAIVKTQRKLCEFKRKNSPLRLKNFEFCDFDIHKIQPSTYHKKIDILRVKANTCNGEHRFTKLKCRIKQWKYCLSPHLPQVGLHIHQDVLQGFSLVVGLSL
jgi:hypothetical protein